MRKAHRQCARDFPVVCVGGSAGGLDAYTRLLRNLPADMGVAVVIVNHLRTVSTLLHEILPRSTTMPVELITEGLVLQPNHVFITQHNVTCMCLTGNSSSSRYQSPGDGPT
jgi:two-component system, chemotaxis family, protein-glutamate methylesterase/glutaminase